MPIGHVGAGRRDPGPGPRPSRPDQRIDRRWPPWLGRRCEQHRAGNGTGTQLRDLRGVGPRDQGTVRIRGPSRVMATACAARVMATVFSAHPSGATSYSPPSPAAATWTGPERCTTSSCPGKHGSRRFVALVVLDLRARAATLLGDADGAAIAYARLRPRARYFVVGGTGVVAIDGSAGQTRGCLAPGQARRRGPASPGCHRRQPGRRAAAARAPASRSWPRRTCVRKTASRSGR